MKHLVVDARTALPQVDGLGTYLRQVVPQLCEAGERSREFRTTVLMNPTMESFWRQAAPSAALLASHVRPMRFGQNWQIQSQIGPLHPDLYFYPAHDPPLFLRAPLVFTIHDVTLFRMRPYFEHLDRAKRGYLKVVTPAGLRRARAVFAVSETTRSEIGEIFGRDLLAKIHVTPNGIGDAPAHSPSSVRDRILYVGTDRPHKNLSRVIEAYGILRSRMPEAPPLDVVGGLRSPDLLRQAIRHSGVEDSVRLRGHVTDLELETCYAHATLLVFPSLAEGFGLPILEAMSRRVPVVTSNRSACAEVAADAALTVDPTDARSIADAMMRVLTEPALVETLISAGLKRAASFRWQRTAALTLEVIRDCLGSSSQNQAAGQRL